LIQNVISKRRFASRAAFFIRVHYWLQAQRIHHFIPAFTGGGWN